MYHVNADDLPGNEVSRTFEGGRHGPCTVSFFLVHNHPARLVCIHAAPAMTTQWDD
jgi:hypothetical protein